MGKTPKKTETPSMPDPRPQYVEDGGLNMVMEQGQELKRKRNNLNRSTAFSGLLTTADKKLLGE